MKKFYTLLLSAAVAFGSYAVEMKLSQNVNGLVPATVTKDKSELGLTFNAGAAIDAKLNTDIQSRAKAAKTPPTGAWNNLGEGTWFEGLLTRYSDIPSGLSWKLTIEESQTKPGYYRMQPYGKSGNFVTDLMGETDPTYVYVDATNPNKVIVDGDMLFYGMIIFSQLNAENDWSGYNQYGKLSNEVITFEPQSFAYTTNGSDWYLGNTDGEFKIALPGADVKDYSLSLFSNFCADENKVVVQVAHGTDVASLKYVLLDGYYTASASNNAVVASNGTALNLNNTNLNASGLPTGLYSLLVVAMDADNNVQAGANVAFFSLDNDDNNWEEYGTASFEEGVLSSIFSDIDAETLSSLKVQQHATTDGYFRIAEPYKNHSVFGTSNETHSHGHFMYINATDPNKVYLEASTLGFNFSSFGQGLLWSWAGRYIAAGQTPDAEDLGTYSNNVITMPDASLMFAFNNYNKGTLMTCGENFKITLTPTPTGVTNVATDNANAPVEYFNLQGVRVANPEAGQLVIRRQGTTVEKVVLR